MKEDYLVYLGLGIFAFILIMLVLNSQFTNKCKTVENLENMDGTSDSKPNLAGNAIAHLELLKKANEDLSNKLLLNHTDPNYKETYENMIVELDKYIDNKSTLLMTDIDLSANDANIIKKMTDINTLTQFKTSLNRTADYLSKHSQ
jgi:regulatory protein YycI of two-component signal transduction system YycFG